MCFSAEVSFVAGAAIGVIGAASLNKANTTPQKVFAAIPLLFGVQQITEGFLWIALTYSAYAEYTNIVTHVFLFFAWVVWPFYVPLSIRLLERKRKRKMWLNVLLVTGILVSSILLYNLLFHKVSAEVMGSHISYVMGYELNLPLLVGAMYFAPIVGSLYVSSRKKMWLLGSLVLLSFIISAGFYREHLISVWCFFAAFTSIAVLWLVYRMKD